MELEEYGRSTADRINYLIKNLTDQEKNKYFRLDSFVKLWASSTGGSLDINQHTDFFSYVHNYSIKQIDAVFFKKFNIHIEKHIFQLGLTKEEWELGVEPLVRPGT